MKQTFDESNLKKEINLWYLKLEIIENLRVTLNFKNTNLEKITKSFIAILKDSLKSFNNNYEESSKSFNNNYEESSKSSNEQMSIDDYIYKSDLNITKLISILSLNKIKY